MKDKTIVFRARHLPLDPEIEEAVTDRIADLRADPAVHRIERADLGGTTVWRIDVSWRAEDIAMDAAVAILQLAEGGRILLESEAGEPHGAWVVGADGAVPDVLGLAEAEEAFARGPVSVATLTLDDLPVRAFRGDRAAAAAWLENNGGAIRDRMIADGIDAAIAYLEADGLDTDGPNFGAGDARVAA